MADAPRDRNYLPTILGQDSTDPTKTLPLQINPITGRVLVELSGAGDGNDKGYFINPAALNAAYPVGQDGWFAIVGSTDTVWIWDSGTSAWVNSGTSSSGDVISAGKAGGQIINGGTGVGENLDLSSNAAIPLTGYIRLKSFFKNISGSIFSFIDQNGVENFRIFSNAGAVNNVGVTNEATGVGPQVFAMGTDANIDLNLNSKGTGKVKINGSIQSGTNTGDQDLSGLVVKNGAITGATKTKITYDAKGLVTAGADATTADIAASTNKNYVTDAQLTTIGNTSGTNTGDETTATIKSKLGAASAGVDGYITGTDWSTFNGKQAALGFTPENVSNKSTDITLGGGTPSDTLYSSQKAAKTYIDSTVASGAPDATTILKGKVKLAGDLGGTADLPTVPGLASKQDTLVSGTNIKTINGNSLLGSGDLTLISGGGDMTKAVYDPANISQQLVGISATQTLTNKTINDPTNYVDADAIHLKVYNNSGGSLTRLQAVRMTAWNVANSCPEIGLAQANSAINSVVLGVVEDATIANGAVGQIRIVGNLINANTNVFSTADRLYLSPTVAGGLQSTIPTVLGQYIVPIGEVGQQSATVGTANISIGMPIAVGGITKDANGNISVNNVIEGYRTTVTSASPVTLTVGSTYQQYFTGTLNQTIVMPVTSTLTTGHTFYIDNNSSGTVTINSSGGNLIATLASGICAMLTCINTGVTDATGWDFDAKLNYVTPGTTGNVLTSNGSNWISSPATSFSTFATAGGTTTLTNASSSIIQFTGSSNQICVLPDATTIPIGKVYFIDNDSTGTITVNANGGANVITLPSNTCVYVNSYDNTTAGGNWDGSAYFGEIFANGKSLTVNNTMTLSGTDGNSYNLDSLGGTSLGLVSAISNGYFTN